MQTLERKQHLEQAVETVKEDSIQILNKLRTSVDMYKNSGNWDKAAETLKLLADKLNTPDDVFDYAYYCECQNKHIDALNYYNRVLELNNESCLPDDSIICMIRKASILNNMASVNSKINHLEESEELYLEALDIRRWLMEVGTKDVKLNYAHTLANLAILYTNTYRHEKSIMMFKEAKSIYQDILADNILNEYANLLIGYAYQLSKANYFEDSKDVYLEALTIVRKLVENDSDKYNRLLASALNSMATLYLDYKYYSNAEPLFMESLSIRRKAAKDNPERNRPDLAQTLYNISIMYQEMNKPEECESYYKECIDVSRKNAFRSPEAYNSKLADALNNMGNFYLGLKRFEDSEKAHKEALEIRQSLMILSPSAFKPDVTQSLYNLGALKINQGRYDDAINPLTKCVEICRSISNPNIDIQKRYLNSLWVLFQIYLFKKDRVNQFIIFELLSHISVDNYRTINDINSDVLSAVLGNMSFNALFLKQFEKAEQYAYEGLKTDSTQHWIASNLAAAILLQGRYTEAEPIYRQYKDELKDAFLDDFKQFKAAGVIPKEREEDVEKIKRMLEE